MKKTLYLMMALLMMAGAVSSCGKMEEDYSGYSEEELQGVIAGKFDELFGEERPWQEEEMETAEEEAEPVEEKADYHDIRYYIENYGIVELGTYHNGLARFDIGGFSEFSYTDEESDITYINGHYGYVDTNGVVVWLPVYTELPERFEPPFYVEFDVVSAENPEEVTGNRIFAGENAEKLDFVLPANTQEISKTQNGYFWVSTKEVLLSGNRYSMIYYNTRGEEVFSVEGAKPVVHCGDYDSSFSEDGYALVEINERNYFIDTTGELVSLQYTGTFEEKILDMHIRGVYGNVALIDLYYMGIRWGETRELHYDNWMMIDWENQTFQETESWGQFACSVGDKFLHSGKLYMSDLETVAVDFSTMEAFAGAELDKMLVTGDERILVTLRNSDGESFCTICDAEGNVLMEPTALFEFDMPYNTVSIADTGLYKIYDPEKRLWGFIAEDGTVVIEPQYQAVGSFSQNRCIVKNNGVRYLLDEKGDVVFQY